MRFLRGRAFNDEEQATGARKVVVDENMAKRFWGDRDPVGDRVMMPAWKRGHEVMDWAEVVGVVAHCQMYYPGEVLHGEKMVGEQIYMPTMQESQVYVALHSVIDSHYVVGNVRSTVSGIKGIVVLRDWSSLEDKEIAFASTPRFVAVVVLIVASIAIILNVIGVYSATSYRMLSRMREYGIRLALGARPKHIVGGVLKSEGKVIMVGGIAGLIGCLWARPVIDMYVNNVFSIGSGVLVVCFIAYGCITLMACAAPAVKVCGMDIYSAIRLE
jgi:hypothetical protein